MTTAHLSGRTSAQSAGGAPLGAPRHPPVDGAPWLPRGYLPRRELWRRLDEATANALTMVVAPAGSGKTLGVGGWLQQSRLGADATWTTAHDGLTVADLRAVIDGAASSGGTGARLVVIDDANTMSPSCVRHIDQRLADEPQNIRLLLLTRWDLAISRLMPDLLGALTVLRGDVVRLDADETSYVVAHHAHTEDPEVLQAIHEWADGWFAAAVLASRAWASTSRSSDLTRRIQQSRRGVADLVAGEVFAALHPPERHLLLCAVDEGTLTPGLARHLTQDRGAGEVLGALESTGLLVHRLAEHEHADVRYRIHPVLLEVARRCRAGDGVDARQSHATVLRAARLDLARGDTHDGFRRLVALGEQEAATDALVEHGPTVTVSPNPVVHRLVRDAISCLEDRPDAWPAIAWAHWVDGDSGSAEHWARRVIRHAESAPKEIPAMRVLAVRLRRSRSGSERVEPAVRDASALLVRHQAAAGPVLDEFLPLLLVEQGAALNWLGRLGEAERRLREAVLLGQSHGLRPVVAEALSHLALTHFMAGRERHCRDLALQALQAVGATDGVTGAAAATVARAEVALQLAQAQSLPWGDFGDTVEPITSVPDDRLGRFWHRVCRARQTLRAGDADNARAVLELAAESQDHPPVVSIALALERAAYGLLVGNRVVLREEIDHLQRLGGDAESAWVRGLEADLDGDLQEATALLERAAEIPSGTQPDVTPAALVCLAQLYHRQGEVERAQELLARAIDVTEAGRCASPFLGWSLHGTRVGVLLSAYPELLDRPWTAQLREACADRPPVVTAFRSTTPTAREIAHAGSPATVPTLSRREHDVLVELARGSSYADIAADLFVSENTVKTHVSNLYCKLSVGRRSDALAVARKLHLL
ncbi:LuxR C-terminal-related transcriptional regulator [Luteipulveratus flavus]|uniref:LuxR C-terminal-related transcriptional regulator n=1 Tax=Luteipulveratus flavus TaxID=3031728 RepID=A0ABT6C1S3_9MICO|nr:LuxR C-terminal-related transcriptional regulator [Luteipulveratus sp. YIM 133296]MDF8262700.1 LuxR C-terminal-related transcriptional regulator [Luteipulveratus sp. YIM 133296]